MFGFQVPRPYIINFLFLECPPVEITIYQRWQDICVFVSWIFYWFLNARLGFPAKPRINLHHLNGEDDYAELSSRFKGSAVKILVWWLARESQTCADRMPNDPLKISNKLFWIYTQFLFTAIFVYNIYYLKKSCQNSAPKRCVWLATQDRIVNLLAVTAYNLQRFVEIMDGSGLVLNNDEAEEASSCLQIHLKTYAVLADHFFQRRIMMYKIRCKSHYMWHAAVEVGVFKINQNLFHTFQEESFLGKVKAIAVRCHGRTCCHRLYQRYFLVLALFLEECRKGEVSLEYRWTH